MTNKQTRRARRQAAQRTQRRRQRVLWTGVAAALVLGIGAFVAFSSDSGNPTTALAPDFELETIDGDTLELSSYRGQPVAVTFMHTY